MRKLIIYILPITILFSSCESFLTYKDKDKIVPVTLQNFSELAYTELMSNSSSYETDYLNIMTDDLESFVTPKVPNGTDVDDRIEYANYYKWAQETQFTDLGKEREDMSWNSIYRRILIANVIEDKMSEFDDDPAGVKQRLIGEVKFIRAMSYFNLINLYAAPYTTAEEAKNQLAVPINSASSIDIINYKRAKMDEVCALIEQNLIESINYLKIGEERNSKFRPSIDAARLYLTRYYLYTKQWAKVVEVANECLSETNRSIMTLSLMGEFAGDRGILNSANPSVIFSWGKSKNRDFASYGNSNNRGRFIVSADLLSKFEAGDERKNNFFQDRDGISFLPFKYDPYTNDDKDRAIYTNTLRIEEVYLNRAEANIELGNINDAIADINKVRRERITSNPDISASDVATATQILRDEKRKEFCFEGVRWFDIRRWNLSITHVYQDFSDPNSKTTFKLEAGSPNYIMPLPLNLIRKNPEIEQFSRINCQVN